MIDEKHLANYAWIALAFIVLLYVGVLDRPKSARAGWFMTIAACAIVGANWYIIAHDFHLV